MDPVERTILPGTTEEITVGELVSYYYEKLSEVYDSPEIRDLAVATIVEDLLCRR